MVNLQAILTKLLTSCMLTSDIVVEGKSKTVGTTYSNNAVGYVDISVAKSGYTAIGIVAFAGSGSAQFAWQDWYFTGLTNARLYFRNISGGNATLNSVSINVLYKKTR